MEELVGRSPRIHEGIRGGQGWKVRYGQKIVRTELGKPMVELCPLLVNEDGVEPVVRKTSTVRVWTVWPAFDMQICKFEVERWLDACDVHIRRDKLSDRELARVDGIINSVLSECSLKRGENMRCTELEGSRREAGWLFGNGYSSI